MQTFPLPPLSQDNYTEYYSKQIPRRDDLKEIIVYPGKQLSVTTKNRNLKKIVKPENVFITKLEDGTFLHRLYGSDNLYTTLPKRLHSVCFPKIHLGSIPPNNRIKFNITEAQIIELPYIPDDFYKQKIIKSERPNAKPNTRRNLKRKATPTKTNVSNNKKLYKGWTIYNNKSDMIKNIDKQSLLNCIQECILSADEENTPIPHPFIIKDNETVNDINKEKLFTIIQFIYYYARDEFRMRKNNDNTTHYNSIWEKIKNNII